jgi:adenosylcobinamide-GDP ribazoletransferase
MKTLPNFGARRFMVVRPFLYAAFLDGANYRISELQQARKASDGPMSDTPDPKAPKTTPQGATSTDNTAPSPRRVDYDLRDAVAFLTRLPVGLNRNAPISQICWAFPLVGALVGALGGGAFLLLLAMPLPPLIAAIAAFGFMIFLTGALHEDGLADAADGFGGGFDATRKIEIMRDSRIGAFGVLALIVALGLRVSTTAALFEIALPALIVAGALSRAFIPALMYQMSPAATSGLAASAGRPGGGAALVSLGFGIGAAIIAFGPGPGLAIAATTAASAVATGALAQRQIGGYNGDVLGAAQQIGEIAALLCILILQGREGL